MTLQTTSHSSSKAPAIDAIGTATMKGNGDIVLQLRAPLDDGDNFGEGYFEYQLGTPEHQDVLRHLGGLVPGQSKPVPPWPNAGNAP